jgi:hypothetical protein
VDDVHLNNASLTRTRKALTEFIDKRMHDGDQVAIVSTSGIARCSVSISWFSKIDNRSR